MNIKRFICVLLSLIMMMTMVQFSAFATDVDYAETGFAVEVTTYKQLKDFLYNSPNGELYVLKNDIVVDDNENDNEIVVGAFSRCSLDLNGYTLSRTTRGIDNCLINVNSGAEFTVYDSSDDNTGKMVYSSGNYAGTSAVIIANGNVDIYGGTYEIYTPYEVGGGGVFLLETGYLNIYDGVFDSHTAFGGDTIELRHNASVYNVPHCNVYGGVFYGKISNFEVSSFSNFTSEGCFYPSVYVFDGEFYIAEPDNEYAGFAYCNNGWGQVIVAGGTVFYKCLNGSDQRFIDGVSKNSIQVTYEGKTGTYYEVTPPVMIGSDSLSLEERLAINLMKKEFSIYSKNGTVYKTNQELIELILNHVDTIDVPQAIEESPLMWIENPENVKTVSWYMCDAAHYDGENTVWSELADFRGCVLPFRFDFRPEEETILYIRALITMDNGDINEDVIIIHYEELKLNPPVTFVDITGVEEVVVGAHPDFDFDDTSEYYISAVYWKDVTTNDYLKETDVFEAGHTYNLEVWLRSKEGYKFNTDSDGWIDITAAIGSKEAEVVLPGAYNAAIISIEYTAEEKQPDILLGDVDGDKKVSVMDATEIQMYKAQMKDLTDEQKLRADADRDKLVSVMDATQIQRLVAQLIEEF